MCPTGWACRVRGWPFFFFSDTATTEIYTLSLHDALPIAVAVALRAPQLAPPTVLLAAWGAGAGVALLAAVTARARTEHRTDLRRERRLRFWDGPLGRWLFRLSGRPAPRAAAPPPPAAGLPSYRTQTAPDSAPVRGG